MRPRRIAALATLTAYGTVTAYAFGFLALTIGPTIGPLATFACYYLAALALATPFIVGRHW